MIKTDANLFGRVATAMVTPFDADLKVDHAAVRKIVEHLLKNGTDTIVVCGTTGESPTLDEAEKQELLKTVIAANGGKAKIIMGTGSNDTAKSVRATKEAESAGVDGALVVAPYYNKPSQDGMLAHFGAIADATSLPLVIYNIPGRTGVNINSDTLIELAKRHDNVHAVKDSTGNVEQAAEIAGQARDTFRVYSGDDYLTLPFLSVGACGIVSVASHLVGTQIQQIIAAYFDGNHDEARKLHYQYLPLFKGLFTAPNPTCVKYALSKIGLCQPTLRLPLVPLNAAQRDALDKVLSDLKVHARV
ncbi:MAG: 4-hydroxy-tetrahydrodipicolinate synthase [Candidatus Obscuribacterales bacterium]